MNLLFFFFFLVIGLFSGGEAGVTDDNDNVRHLAGNVIPSFYKIKIHPFFDAPGVTFEQEKNETFDGEVSITCKVLQRTSTIILNAFNLTFPNSSANFIASPSTGIKVKISKILTSPTNQTITLFLERPLEKGEKIVIVLKYSGKIQTEKAFGFFKSSDGSEVVYVTQFETTGARWVFPCFDEPDYKANFQISIVKPKAWVAISNSDPSHTQDIGDGYEEVKFAQSAYISSYLVAFGIGDLIAIEGTSIDGTLIHRVWSLPSGEGKMTAALKSAIKCGDAMAKYTDYQLPLKKIDHLGVPDFSGGMENFGLIVYTQGLIEFNPRREGLENWYYVTNLVCHEVSHHWFGDTVTNKWWGDLWLHEGFANFFQYKAVALAYPNEQDYTSLQFAKSNAEILEYKGLLTHPVITKNGDFDAVTYDFGAAVIRQLETVISPEILQKALQSYIKKYKNSNANYHQLLDELQKAVDETDLKDWCGEAFDVTKFMNLWLNQKGFPTLMVDYDDEKGFIITQKVDEDDEKFWPLPILAQYSYGGVKMYWSAPNYKCQDKTVPPQLIIYDDILFLHRDELAVTQIRYTDDALEKIMKSLTTSDYKFQLSSASIYAVLQDISQSIEETQKTQQEIQGIWKKVLVSQKDSLNFGIFDEISRKINSDNSEGRFNNDFRAPEYPDSN